MPLEMDVRIVLFIASLCAGCLSGWATPQPSLAPPSQGKYGLDTAGIRKSYMNGDFDEATEHIESALRKGGPFSHDDSVFIYKHLGVMYTAKYETREKGKSYLFKLLQVEPGARIVDMYASDMIYMIFKNICDEFDLYQTRQKHPGKSDENGTPGLAGAEASKTGNTSTSKRKSRSLAWLGWTAGALAATGGVALVVALSSDDDGRIRNNIVP